MTTLSRNTRRGFTLLELIAVLAAIIILGAFLVPNMSSMRGDTRTKAGADVLQSYISKARSKAIEDGIPYRFAIYLDGKRVRIAPDTFESLGELPTAADDDDATSGPVIREDDLPVGVTATVTTSDDDGGGTQDQSGWKRVATFLPDGTCREDAVEVTVSETGVSSVIIRLRGITGLCTVSRGEQSQ